MVGDQRRGAHLLAGQLGVLVDVAPPLHHARLEGVEAGAEFLQRGVVECLRTRDGALAEHGDGGGEAQDLCNMHACFHFRVLS